MQLPNAGSGPRRDAQDGRPVMARDVLRVFRYDAIGLAVPFISELVRMRRLMPRQDNVIQLSFDFLKLCYYLARESFLGCYVRG